MTEAWHDTGVCLGVSRGDCCESDRAEPFSVASASGQPGHWRGARAENREIHLCTQGLDAALPPHLWMIEFRILPFHTGASTTSFLPGVSGFWLQPDNHISSFVGSEAFGITLCQAAQIQGDFGSQAACQGLPNLPTHVSQFH